MRDIVQTLIDTNVVKFGQFRIKLHDRLPDAPLSPIYINLRLLRSYPSALKKVVDAMCQLVNDNIENFDLIADVPTAGTPFSVIASQVLNIPMITPRMDIKSHGLSDRIDGTYSEGKRVLIIDDLITAADSKLQIVGLLENAGLRPTAVLVVLDREQGGRAGLEKRGIKLITLLTITELLSSLLDIGHIDESTYKNIRDYLNKWD